MKLVFRDNQTSAPFEYATWKKTRCDAATLTHDGMLFVGEPGVPLNKLLELRLREGEWAADPIQSGATQTNRTEKSLYFNVTDHINITDFVVDISGIPGAERVGTPIIMDVYLKSSVQVEDPVLARSITLGYIGGVTTTVVPFFNPPTNPRQQTVLVLNNHENANVVNVIAVDVDGTVLSGDLTDMASGHQHVIEASEVYAAVGAEPIAGNKLRLIICSSAPLTVVSKVRDSDSGLMCDNAVTVL